MSIIKTVIQTAFTSSGADKVVAETEQVNKSQTRLGQSSASTGRQFAAQSQGLGGLVAAYAGAAATLFAVEAAYTALAKAAAAENIVKGTSMLAAEIGQSGPKILKELEAITQGQITLAETAQNTNLALSAGFNTSQIKELTIVAQKAATALGRDLSDSFQRLVKGSAKLEPELLDELGIFTRIDPAVKKYAKSLGVSSDSLSEFERRQAFVNSVIEEGNRKFASIDTSAPSAQKSLAQLLTQIQNLSNTFLNLINTALGPVVKFFSDDFGNSLVLFGALLLLVFKKAGSIVSDFGRTQASTMNAWANNIITNVEKASGSFDKLEKSQEAFKKGISDRGGLLGADKSGRFATGSKEVNSRLTALRNEFREGIISTLSVQEISSRMNQLNADFEKFGSKLGTIAREDVVAMQTSMTTFINGTSKGTQRVVSGLEMFKKGLTGIARAADFAFTAISWIFAISSLLELAGIDVLGWISEKLGEIGKTGRMAQEGFVGFTLAASGGSDKLVASLKAVGATEDDISKASEKIKELNTEINNTALLRKAAEARAQSMSLGGGAAGFSLPTDSLSIAQQKLAEVNDQIASARADQLPQLRIEAAYLTAIIASYENYGKELSLVTSQLSGLTGLSGEKVGKVISQSDVDRTANYITVFGMAMRIAADGVADINSLTEAQKRLLGSYVNISSAINEANDAFDRGNTNTQSLAAAVAGSSAELEKAKESAKEYAKELMQSGVPAAVAFDITRQRIEQLSASIDGLRTKLKDLEKLEAIGKGITSTFGSAISTLKDLQFKGTVDSAGNFAKSQEQVYSNQITLLLDTLKNSKAAYQKYNDLLEQGKNADQATIQAASNYENAAKALAGSLIEKYIAASEAGKSAIENLRALRQEAIATFQEITKEEIVLKARFELDTGNLQREAALAAQQSTLDLLNADLSIVNAKKQAGAITPKEAATQENSIQQQILIERRNLIALEAQNSRDAIAQELAIAMAERDNRLSVIEQEAKIAKEKVDAEVKLLQNQLEIYNQFLTGYTEANNGLITGFSSVSNGLISGIATALYQGAQSLANVLAPFGAGAASAVQQKLIDTPELLDAAKLTADLSTMSLKVGAEAVLTKFAIEGAATAQKKAAEEEYDRVVDLAGQRLNAIDTQEEAQLTALNKATEAEKYLADSRLKSAEAAGGSKEKEAELTDLQKKLTELFDSIKGNIENALMGLNDLVFYGEGNFGDIMSNLFKSIQQDLFKTTIADPASDFLTESIFSLFGIQGGKKGIENAKVTSGGALLVQMVNSTSELLGGAFGDKNAEDPTKQTNGILGGFFDKIGGFFSNLFGTDGIFSKLFSGLFGQGGILSGLFGGIFSLFGFGAAQGGLMHLAQGGAAMSSTVRRDRIPAMLEPGEFVLRKQAVKSVGVPALQAMNATGASNTGAPIINISNEGSPKEVQAAQPRFDGEKYVIDIVMRDFANNGPIRRSLRAKGGL